MTDIRSTISAGGAWPRLTLLGAVLMIVAVACSSGDDDSSATASPSEPAATEAAAASVAPAADDGTEPDGEPAAGEAAPSDAAGSAASAGSALDFGSGTGSITLAGETFELAVGPGTGLCRDVFGIIQAGGSAADGRDIDGSFMIPPLDWETYTDGRYDPPSVGLEISSTGDDNASWRADAAWAQENDKVGMSQVDSYEKDGLTASGSATFANLWDADAESVQGTFEVSCAEG